MDCLRVRTQQDNLPSHIRGDLMARNLQDAREAIEPQQAHRRRRKCYLGLSHQKKVNLSECNRMLCNDHHVTQGICTASINP